MASPEIPSEVFIEAKEARYTKAGKNVAAANAAKLKVGYPDRSCDFIAGAANLHRPQTVADVIG